MKKRRSNGTPQRSSLLLEPTSGTQLRRLALLTPRELPRPEKRRIPPLKRTKIKRFTPADREVFAAFKAGTIKPLVRKTFPKEVVDERLGQMADHMISRVPKMDRDRISRERLIEKLRAMLVASPLREVDAEGNSGDW